MKVCIYYKPVEKPWGGSNSFILNLIKYLKYRGVDITFNLRSDFDVLVLNGAYRAPGKMIDYGRIRKLKEKGHIGFFSGLAGRRKKTDLKIVYRLDGLRKVYAGIDSKMDEIQLKCMDLADHIVFQSDYSLKVFTEFGYKGDHHSIIYNGVDGSIFDAEKNRKWENGGLKIAACSWSENAAKGHALVSRISKIDDVEVSFIGRWPCDVPVNNVKNLGILSQGEIARVFRGSHVFLFPAEKEACSNTLLEALSSGLPVLYTDSGSNSEISRGYGVDLNEKDLHAGIREIKNRYREFRENIFRDRARFSIEHSGKKYLELFTGIHGHV